MKIIKIKKRLKNSVKLSKEDHECLKDYYTQFDTDLDFAEAFNMNRVTLKRILDYGSGKESSIVKIRRKLKRIYANA